MAMDQRIVTARGKSGDVSVGVDRDHSTLDERRVERAQILELPALLDEGIDLRCCRGRRWTFRRRRLCR